MGNQSIAAGVTLVLGGARSGKSRYAETLVTSLPRPWLYIATAEALDDEMAARIATHRARRSAAWQTVEAPINLAEALVGAPKGATVMVDCLTLWLSNLMTADGAIDREITNLEKTLANRSSRTVLVSNEVGFGIVPDNALARRFRDRQGLLNQAIAARASRVVMMVAGLPMILKDNK